MIAGVSWSSSRSSKSPEAYYYVAGHGGFVSEIAVPGVRSIEDEGKGY